MTRTSRSLAVAATLLFAGSSWTARAQATADDRSGVAHPPEAITVEPPAQKVVLPSLPPVEHVVVPAVPASIATTSTATDADIVTSPAAPASTSSTPELKARTESIMVGAKPLETASEDDMIVTAIPAAENEIPRGTLVRVRFTDGLSTENTQPGATLLGQLIENIVSNGRVLVPAGSSVTATVTSVRGGKRIHGAAMVHIEPRSFTLADGTSLPLHATLIDSDTFNNTRVDAEGNLIRKDHAKETLTALGLTTGGAAAAGGVIAGVPGALVGAGVGAGISTVWWLKQDRQLHIAKDSTMVFQMTSPTLVTSARMQGAE